jgi:3-hydroxyisobutyrate dehydrogenase-like beta-hydroxyacid dehydrogenase
MGKPMALNLLKKGFAVTVHSRSRGPVTSWWRPAPPPLRRPPTWRPLLIIVTMLPTG